MSVEALQLTAYFGERDRIDGRLLSDAIVDRFGRDRVAASALLRGLSGFGAKHQLRTDRLLTLSEDLPLVAVAVDEMQRIRPLADEVAGLMGQGLLSLERARLVREPTALTLDGSARLTAYVGRGERVGGQPAARAVVEALHRRGVAGATVLLGVDGTAHGQRRRATFFGRNADVPLMIVAVGDAGPVGDAVGALTAMLPRPLLTLERVTVLKRDGRRLAEPPAAAGGDWVKLMVYASEASRSGDAPLHAALVERLRQAGARGATLLRGVWGYHGDHPPHGDRLLALRRRVPVVAVVVDAPERAGAWWRIVDEVTERTGVVTWERLPAVRAGGRGSPLDTLAGWAP